MKQIPARDWPRGGNIQVQVQGDGCGGGGAEKHIEEVDWVRAA